MKKFLKKFFGVPLSNRSLQLLSVVIAVICWYGIQSVTDADSTIYQGALSVSEGYSEKDSVILPISVVAPSRPSAVRIGVEPQRARVRLHLAAKLSAEDAAAKLSLFVDCSSISGDGEYRLPIRCIASGLGRVIDIEPASAMVSIEFID